MNVSQSRGGFTLVELIVALAVMGISAGLATVAFRSLFAPPADPSVNWVGQVRAAQRRAVESGRPTVLRTAEGSPILFLPDARTVGDGIELLTGSVEPRP